MAVVLESRIALYFTTSRTRIQMEQGVRDVVGQYVYYVLLAIEATRSWWRCSWANESEVPVHFQHPLPLRQPQWLQDDRPRPLPLCTRRNFVTARATSSTLPLVPPPSPHSPSLL